MPITVLTSRQFHQNRGLIKQALKNGPVHITDRGKLAMIIQTPEQCEQEQAPRKSLLEMLAMPEAMDFDFEAPRIGRETISPVNLE